MSSRGWMFLLVFATLAGVVILAVLIRRNVARSTRRDEAEADPDYRAAARLAPSKTVDETTDADEL